MAREHGDLRVEFELYYCLMQVTDWANHWLFFGWLLVTMWFIYGKTKWLIYIYIYIYMVGGLEHVLFFHMLGIIVLIDS